MKTLLLTCPWCSVDGVLTVAPKIDADGNLADVYAVNCESCGCEGPVEESVEAAVTAWNRRQEPMPLREARTA